MALAVIGAGFGRTGTLSFKLALEQLGLGPCYHMLEVFGNAAHLQAWDTAIAGEPVDWDLVLGGYRSTCDWPACTFWRELKGANPGAKVVLTRRDPDAWYRSMTRTIFESLERPVEDGADPMMVEHQLMVRKLILERTFGGDLGHEHVLGVLAAHEQDVIGALAPEELLVYDVAEGWGPLCDFLGTPMPDEPFPNTNTTADFRTMVGLDPI